jgi:hypothetical protein
VTDPAAARQPPAHFIATLWAGASWVFYIGADPIYQSEMLENLSTAHLADGCLRIGVQPRCVSAPSAPDALDRGGPKTTFAFGARVVIFCYGITATAKS